MLRECYLVMERPRTRSSGSRDKRHGSEISLARKRARLSVAGEDPSMAEANGGCSGGQAREKLGNRGWVDRGEFTRLLQQGLHSLGYADVAQRLEQVIQTETALANERKNAHPGLQWIALHVGI